MKLYKLEKIKAKEKQPEESKKGKSTKAAQGVTPKASGTSVTSGSSTESGGEDPYESMDDVTKACFDVRLIINYLIDCYFEKHIWGQQPGFGKGSRVYEDTSDYRIAIAKEVVRPYERWLLGKVKLYSCSSLQ